MATPYQVVLCSFPNAQIARECAVDLVEQCLAACVNVLPAMTSVYKWQGDIEMEDEHLLLIKACREDYPAIESYLLQHHPYDIPEIIALPISGGFETYLNWVKSCHKTG